jgi:pyruvate/2-oxoglutarate dehydrogenase complex dihydrolipoamide acyltransferase (E2) component
MSDTVIMPQLGETVAEGKILAWFKSVGDEIKEGDNLFEVETDKVTIEVQAVVSGRLNEIRVGSGDVAKVGAIVAVIGSELQPSPRQTRSRPQRQRRPRGAGRSRKSRRRRRDSVPPGPTTFAPPSRAADWIAQNGLDIAGLAAEVKVGGGADRRAARALRHGRLASNFGACRP